MKRTVVVLLLLAASMTAAAQEQIILGLIPTPQSVVGQNQTFACNLHKAKVVERKVDTLRVEANVDQAYQLVFAKSKIYLYYVGEEGRQNAYRTLAQLKQLHTSIPCVTITDWPAYRYRGWMDDISRGPVPHEAFRKKQWETLHALKYNFCNYYTEHTLYQKEFPDLAPAYADAQRHSDEVINLQLFAHAEKTLRVPFYQYLMDCPTSFNPGIEATYDFLRKRIAEAVRQNPSSEFFVIDCDETEQIGTGRAKRHVDTIGSDQVYVNHINRCYDLVKGFGDRRVVMWGDIVAKNPAMMRQLPDDMVYIMWAYEPLDSFDELIRPFKEQGNPFWVAPSVYHHENMIPNPHRYMKNIANLARDGYHAGAEGLMNTTWDDNGEALFDNCWHGLFWSAEMAWNPIKTDDTVEFRRRERQFNENFERLFYGVKDGKVLNVAQLYEVGALEYHPSVADWYLSASLMAPLLIFNPDNTGDAMKERYWKVSEVLENFTLDSTANPHAHYAVARMLLTAYKCYLRQIIYQELNNDLYIVRGDSKMVSKAYLQALFDLKREYLRLWDQENGDYERYIILNRYDALAREVLELDRHVFMEVLSPNIQKTQNIPNTPMVQLRTLYNDRPIYYTLDGSEPTSLSTPYTEPFPLDRSATIRAVSYNEHGEGAISEQHILSHLGMTAKLTLNTPYSIYRSIYSGGGERALVDGLLGSNATYADGHWQGYWGDSIDATIDFGKPTEIHEVSMRFMQYTYNWILAPTCIKAYTSNDGSNWQLAAQKHFDTDFRESGILLRQYHVELPNPGSGGAGSPTPKIKSQNPRFLRIVVPNPGPLPSWHQAPGQPSYIFTDEIIVH